MRKTVLSGAIALSLLSLNTHALSVGEMNVSSHLGEALNVTIDLNATSKSELSTLEVSLASRAAFEQAGIRYPETAEDLIIEVDTKQKGKPKILVKSFNSISEPFVHLLLQITWAGGNMLREYTALIDPVEYNPNPVAKAVSSNTNMGVAKPADGSTPLNIHGMVKSGDSLSSIASLYRPADVTVHQAWMAFYELNRQAFPENNLNKLKKGIEIRIPTRAQMTAVSPSKAAQEVKKLSKALGGGAARAKSPTTKAAPKLVVGGDKEEPARAEEQPAQPPVPAAKSTQTAAAGDSEQIASVRAELGEFKQGISQQLSENNAQNTQFKEELVAARGEGRVLNERIGELEKQLSNISRLLELQSKAMQALNENIEKNGQMQMAAAASSADTSTQQASETESGQTTKAESLAEMTAQKENDAAAPENIPPAAVSSSTEGGTPPVDTNSTDKTGGDINAAQGSGPPSVVNADEVQANIAQSEQRIESLEKEYEEKLKIAESEQRIESLEKEYEEKLEIAQQQAQDTVTQAGSVPATSAETSQQTAQPDSTVRVAREPATPQPMVERSFMDKATGMLGSIGAGLAGISSDIWKIIGVIAAALLGLFAYNGARRRRAEQAEDDDYEFSTLEAVDANQEVGDSTSELLVDEKATPTLEANKSDEKLHGSSLFDLSDESFMASEAVDSDSSMFTMDEELGTASNKMASRGSVTTDLHSSIPTATDIDPLTEADVYLAYDRKEQAINVLEQALAKDSNQPKVVLKLLTLHRDANDVDAFTKVFESSAESIEDDEQWGDIKQLAQDFITIDKLEDDFESSIPVLQDELVEQVAEEVPVDSTADTGVIEFDSPEREEDHDDILEKAIQELENEESLTEIEPEALTLNDEMALSIEEEMENEASMSLDSDGIHGVDGEMLSDITHDIGLDIDREDDLSLDDDIDQNNEADEPKVATVSEENLDEVSEINQHDPETALALANAYIELGENDIAKDFLNDVIAAGSKKVRGKAEKLLASLS